MVNKIQFIKSIEAVSTILADWVQKRFDAGWSIEDVKIVLRNAGKVCARSNT